MKNQLIATGRVESLCVNGDPVARLQFGFGGPVNDVHAGMTRDLDGHDGDYLKTSRLKRGHKVFNWRTWTALSMEELVQIQGALGGVHIPEGCLLENMILTGIREFSQLAATTRLVFPLKEEDGSQLILAVWEQNGPCSGVGDRLQRHHPREQNLGSRFIAAAQHRRGVMGFVLSEGFVEIKDDVLVYPPVQ